MFEGLKKLANLASPNKTITAPTVNRSQLESLFAISGGARELAALPREPGPLTISVILLTHAGKRAARLRDAINTAHERSKGKWLATEAQRINCAFDYIFIEAAALYFWSVMSRFWDDDVGDFWTEDDSPDAGYLETLVDSLDIADKIIGSASTKIPECYLSKEVAFYNETVDGQRRPIDKFAASVVQWLCYGAEPGPGSAARLISGFCMMAVAEVDRNELETICRTVHAHFT
jgi:hypothetical protein